MRIETNIQPRIMQLVFDQHAPKRATNLSLNSDLLKQAKDMGINISQFVERALAEQVKRHKEAQWLRDNREAIDGYNAEVERVGIDCVLSGL